MNHTYLLTGGNLGDRMENLEAAKTTIGQRVGEILKVSAVYETAAWGKEDQPDYLNQVLELQTGNTAPALLKALLEIENELGRVRMEKYDSRLIDIDILFFNDAIIQQPQLTIPHPRLHERRFVLEPLCEIAPGFVHPVFKQSMAQLLQACNDPLYVKKFYPG